ncbi:hypothetical protein LTR50_002925 [Elasticomyces elasticus]|nr:hypothetical protein LTR50_002925 [Elasticomyces elasticus]
MSTVPAPLLPTWRESVLSTRSLSFLSTASALGSPTFSQASPRNISHHFHPSRKSTLNSIPDSASETSDVDMLELRVPIRLDPAIANSSLFALPRELRDRIYAYALNSTSSSDKEITWPVEKLNAGVAVALLRTCNAVAIEATPILYTQTWFAFAHPSDANMFRRAIASPASILTEVMILRLKGTDMRLWTAYLGSTNSTRSLVYDFPHLKRLEIRIKSTRWNSAMSAEMNMRNWKDDPKLGEASACLTERMAVRRPKGDPNTLDVPRVRPNDHAPPLKAQVRVLVCYRVSRSHFESLVVAAARQPERSPEEESHRLEEMEARALAEGVGFGPFGERDNWELIRDPEGKWQARTPWQRRDAVEIAMEIACAEPSQTRGL